MKYYHRLVCVAVVSVWGLGCAGLRPQSCNPCAEGDKGCEYDCEAKTLFKWGICKDEPAANSNEAEKPDVKPAAFQLPPEATGASDLLQNGGNGIASRPSGPREDEDTITTDRPDFTEASSTVGKGRIQLEMGYTYFRDRDRAGVLTQTHSYPELLARIGMFADWFEWRIGQNFGHSLQAEQVTHRRLSTDKGAQDLYLGAKIALTEHVHGTWLPESALILQMTVPTGSDAFSSGKVLPGISYLYSFDLTDKVSLAGSVLGNVAVEDSGHKFWQMASSLSVGVGFTDTLGGYFEYFGFYPTGGIDPTTKPEYYLNGGFTYLITKNVQYDIRAGFGLNRAAADFFAGSGLSLRF